MLILLGFISSTNYNYTLTDGVNKIITHTKDRNYDYYYFTIKVSYPSNIRFSIKTPINCDLNTFGIYEFKSSIQDSPIYQDYDSDFNKETIDKNLIYFFSHTIRSSSTTYVQFRTRIYDYRDNSFNFIARIDLVFEEYYLYNKVPLDIFNLTFNKSYLLYLEFFETININLIIDDISEEPFSNITIHEFKKRENSSSIGIVNKKIEFVNINNQLISSFSYLNALSNFTKYIALQIKPSSNIPHITAKFEYSVTSFDLNDGNWKTFDNLIYNEIYLFSMEVVEDTKINISLFINNTNYEYNEYELSPIGMDGSLLESNPKDSIPFDYIDINVYEYEKKNNSYITYNQKNSKRLKRINESYFVTEKIFLINESNTNYFAFSFKPNYNISLMQVNIDFSGGLFHLINNTSKNIIKLKKDEDYFFYIEAQQFSYARFTLTMSYNSNISTNPFSEIFIQELEKREYYYSYHGYYESISPIIKGNQLIISVSHNISEESTLYINFRINPLYNIDYIIANIEVIDCFIDFDNYENFQGIHYFLNSHFKYYMKMNAWKNYITKYNLKAYNVSKSPFSSMIIYECYHEYYQNLSYWEKKKTQKIKFKKKNDRYEGNFEKKNTLNKHIFLFIEFMPECDIQYLIAETKITEYSKINTLALILIILEIIIFTPMIIYFIYLLKKCKIKKSTNLSTNLAPKNKDRNELISQN